MLATDDGLALVPIHSLARTCSSSSAVPPSPTLSNACLQKLQMKPCSVLYRTSSSEAVKSQMHPFVPRWTDPDRGGINAPIAWRMISVVVNSRSDGGAIL